MDKKMYGFYLRYFFKNKLYILFVLIQFWILIAMISFFCSLDFTGFRLLYLFSRWNFYLSVLFAVFAYIIFTEAISANCEEVIDSITKRKSSWQRGIGSIYLIVILIYHLTLIIGIIFTSIQNDGTRYLFEIFPRTYLMNIVIPQIILLGIAYIASWISANNKMLAHSVVLFFCIMTSPLFENLIWREKPKNFPIDSIVEKIKWLFSIFYKNAEWVPDTQYGLQVENVRLYVQLFWIILIFTMIIWLHKNYKKLSILCFCFSIFFLVISYFPASTYRLNEAWNGIFADFTYYQNEELDIQEIQESDYKISKYELEIDVKNNLSVDGKLTIDAPIERDEFVFTLYHGYRIKKLEVNNEEASFERNGDSIIIKFPDCVKTFELMIKYDGCSGKYYSNSQAIMLPGYFPWYPLAGDRQIFIQYPYYNGGNGYNPYNRASTADFEVKINTNCKFVTNLPKKSGNEFAGTSDGISIIGGNIIKNNNESVVLNYLPLELSNIDGDEYLEKITREWEQLLKETESVFGLDIHDLKAKRIIIASKDLGRNFSNNNFIEFNDYVLVSPDYLNSQTYMSYRLHESGKDSKIGDLFSHALLRSDVIEADEIVKIMMTIEEERQQMLEDLEGVQKEQLVSRQLKEIEQQIGDENLIKEIVQYLLYSELRSDEEFVEYIYENYQLM